MAKDKAKLLVKAYTIPPAFRMTKVPGQVPSKGRLRTLGQVQALSKLGARSHEGAANLTIGRMAGQPERMAMQGKDPFTMPGAVTEARLLALDEPMLSSGSVTRGMGLNVLQTADLTRFLGKALTSAANEIVFRKAVMSKLLESGLGGDVRKAIFTRALSHWRTVQKSRVLAVTPDELLQKGLFIGPRGGKWADAKHTIPYDEKKRGKKAAKKETPESKFERYAAERQQALGRVKKTIALGAEYVSDSGEQFGAVLKEFSGKLPYRVQWYDKHGFSGHSEVASMEDAAKMLVSDLGYGVQQATGSLDKWGIKTPAQMIPPRWAQVSASAFDLEAIQPGQQFAIKLQYGPVQTFERKHSGDFQDMDDPRVLTGKHMRTLIEQQGVTVGVNPKVAELPPVGLPDFEDRQEAKRERFELRAERARAKAAGARKQEEYIAGGIPMGQPILVGHHSEKRHRKDIDRIHRAAQTQYEEGKKAAYYEDRAQSVGESGISSEDPVAVQKLKAKLAALESQRDMRKKINRAFKKLKGNWEAVQKVTGISDQEVRAIVARMNVGFTPRDRPFPSYSLTNLGATIRSTKKRIDSLVVEAEARAEGPRPDIEGPGFTVTENLDENRVQFIFDGKPVSDIRQKLKANGFRWSPTQGAWQRMLNNQGRNAARRVAKELTPEKPAEGPVETPQVPPDFEPGGREAASIQAAKELGPPDAEPKPTFTGQGDLFRAVRLENDMEKVIILTPDDLLQKSVFVGVRGGKWADAAHTIPWRTQLSPRDRRAASSYFNAQDDEKATRREIKVAAKAVKAVLSAKDSPKALKAAVADLVQQQTRQATNLRITGKNKGADKIGKRIAALQKVMWDFRSEMFSTGAMDPAKWQAAKKALRGLLKSVVEDELAFQKAAPRGGSYYRRTSTVKGGKAKHRYFYKPEDYDKRDDAHVDGEAAGKSYLAKCVIKAIGSAGEKGCHPKALGELVKKFGAKKVAEALRDGKNGGTLSFKQGKFSMCKNEKADYDSTHPGYG